MRKEQFNAHFALPKMSKKSLHSVQPNWSASIIATAAALSLNIFAGKHHSRNNGRCQASDEAN